MPYMLVNKLKKLMSKNFPSQLKSTNPYLGKVPTSLPDDVLEEIDEIADTASALFGQGIQPTRQQSIILLNAGFLVRADKMISGVWQSGVIETPKGFISYK